MYIKMIEKARANRVAALGFLTSKKAGGELKMQGEGYAHLSLQDPARADRVVWRGHSLRMKMHHFLENEFQLPAAVR